MTTGIDSVPDTGGPVFALAAIVLGSAIVLGGGGEPAPVQELILELIALAVLATALARHRVRLPPDMAMLTIASAIIALPLLQLIPLPPSAWQALPDREAMLEGLSLVDRAQDWRPWSLDPYRTLAGLLSLIPPMVTFLLIANLNRADRARLLLMIGLFGCVAAGVGLFQLAGSDLSLLYPHQQQGPGLLTGFQANRNHTGSMLLIAALALTAWRYRQPLGPPASNLATAAAIAALSIAVVLTGSRAATGLLALVAAVGFGAAIWWRARGRQQGPARSARLVGLAIVGPALLLGALAVGNIPVSQTIDRFAIGGAGRADTLWPDTVVAAAGLGWVGGGIGTFQTVYRSVERLETVDPSSPNRAHNDWLETLLEVGIAGPLLMLIAGAMAVWRCRHISRSPEPSDRKAHAAFAAATILLLLLQSFVDYPLRTMSLAVMAGVAAGLLAWPAQGARARRGVRG